MNTSKMVLGWTLMVSLALLAGWVLAPAAAQDVPAAGAPKWEYKIVLPDSAEDPIANQAQLDRLGAMGWELCSAHSASRPHYFIFKRIKQ